MTRTVHWVGSFPEVSIPACMRDMSELSGDRIRFIPHGEPNRYWIGTEMETYKKRPDVRVLRKGKGPNYKKYTNMPILMCKKEGRPFNPRLPYTGLGLEALEVIRENDWEFDLQVGIPDPLQIPMFTGGLWREYKSFVAATVEQVADLFEADNNVVVQLEIPAQTVLTHSFGKKMAIKRAQEIADYVSLFPEHTRVGVHLCFGDLGGKPLVRPKSAETVTMLSNYLSWYWPTGRILEYIHVPLADGVKPPSLDARYYVPLADLSSNIKYRMAIGIAHDLATKDELVRSRDLAERYIGNECMISSPCGEGRTDLAKAHRIGQAKRSLCYD